MPMRNEIWRFLGKPALLIVASTSLFLLYLLIKPGNEQAVVLVDNLLQAILEGFGWLLALPLFLPGGERRTNISPSTSTQRAIVSFSKQQCAALLLSLGILSYIVGQLLWTYNEDIIHLVPLFPSWADAGFLSSYPFIFLAILLLPFRPFSAITRVRIVFDSLMIMVAIVTFSWYFILGPTILQGTDTLLGKIVGTAYPLGTLILFFCLLLLTLQTRDRTLHPVVFILTLALLVIIITDSIYNYQELHNLYVTGGVLDIGWPLGYMLVGLSARALRLSGNVSSSSSLQIPSQRAGEGSLLSRWYSLVPYFLVPLVVVLLVITAYEGDNIVLERGVYLGVVLLMGLMIVRQVLVIREATIQDKRVLRAQQEADAKNAELNGANVQLEEQAKQIEKAYEQQRQLNRLKDQFILNVNHELRTPLTQIYGYLELLCESKTQADKELQMIFLKYAREASEELIFIVNNILDATHADNESPQPHLEAIVVAAVIQEVSAHFTTDETQKSRIHISAPPHMLVRTDQRYLRQILRNLLSNALKYAPADTPVTIEAVPHLSPEGSQLCICVQDVGPGIPPDEQPLLFRKFVRLSRDLFGSVRGTGLGLYISKAFVQAMGGSIWVESTGIAGQGSRFCFTLPAVSATTCQKLQHSPKEFSITQNT